jgi:hypothetical protein
MPTPDQRTSRLTDLGLTAYEAKAYLALIARDRYTAAELARQAAIPRQRVYDVLDGLVRRGLAAPVQGAVRRFTAASPDAAIELLVAARRDEVNALSRDAAALADDLRETWVSGRDEGSTLEYVSVVRDRALLALRFNQMRDQAERQLLVWSRPPFVTADDEEGLGATRRLAAAGGDVRCVYESSVLADPALVAEIDAYVAVGEQARVADVVPMKLCITDGSRALFSLTDPVAERLTATNIYVEHASLAASLVMAFEATWKQSTPWRTARRRR